MMEYPVISIIMAVYNAENYLKRSVESVLAQSFPDFELLLINDGSTDGSAEICDNYSRKDKRIKVFHKLNEGVSATRQYGIAHAKGTYTIHIDPDDWIESDMLEALYQEAIKKNADVILTDLYINYKYKIQYLKQRPQDLFHKIVLNDLFYGLRGSCCNKLIKRDCYEKYNIKFPKKIDYCEDLLMCVQLFKYPVKISYLPQAFYHYDQSCNVNSITRIFTNLTITQHLNYIDELRRCLYEPEYKILVKLGILDVLYHEFMHSTIFYPEFDNIAKEVVDYIRYMKIPYISRLLFFCAIKYNKSLFCFLFQYIYKMYNFYRHNWLFR